MEFERGHSYYGYTAEAIEELRDYMGESAFSAIESLFFDYTYNGQTLKWIDADLILDMDFGMVSADWMAVYAYSAWNIKGV